MNKTILRSIAAFLRAAVTPGSSPRLTPGHPPFDRSSMLCAFVCKVFLGHRSENGIHRKLARNSEIRELFWFIVVPSLQTLNCFCARWHSLIESVFKKLAYRFVEVHELDAHLAIDSTSTPVRKTDEDARKGYGIQGWFYP